MENLELLKEDLLEKWNPVRFGFSRKPHQIGTIKNKADFSSSKISVLDMPIKLPYREIQIPFVSKSIEEVVNTCVEFEKSINSYYDDYYLYLTIDQRQVQAGSTQRRPGVHFDGMQGTNYPEKLKVCHSYLVSDTIPTRFFVQPFPKDLDEDKQNWFYEFSKVANHENAMYTTPYDIFFMTAYNVHEATEATYDTKRTFMRLEFSLKKFDREGNTINPLLDTGFVYRPRPIPEHLRIEIFN